MKRLITGIIAIMLAVAVMGLTVSEPIVASAKTEYVTVKKSYFDDAVFVGDSSTEGLGLYTGMSNAKWLAKPSISVMNISDKKVIRSKGKKITIMKALEQKQYGKVYIAFGTNELGYSSAVFMKNYKKVIQKIQKLQPNAIIYVQSILHVTAKKSNSDKYINNKNIDKRNKKIKALAEELGCYYIDPNSAISTKKGNLPAKAASDGVHMNKTYCVKVMDYIKSHAVEPKKEKSAYETQQEIFTAYRGNAVHMLLFSGMWNNEIARAIDGNKNFR